MKKETKIRLEIGLAENKKTKDNSPTNLDLYREGLLREFPLEIPCLDELFYKNSFTDDDEIDYLKGRSIFEGKRWDEIDFDCLYRDYVQFVPLLPRGMIYYLPAFLGYFFDLRHPNLEFRQVLLTSICEGFGVASIEEMEGWYKNGRLPKASYSDFEIFDVSQSKLIALFLVNEANLLPVSDMRVNSAQVALTNYWGNFLLF